MEELIGKIRNLHPGVKIYLTPCLTNQQIFHVQIEDQFTSGTGAGTATDPTLALKKAYSEFIERRALRNEMKKDQGITSSNGFAGHITSEEAAKSAIGELIERDAILSTWLAKVAPYWLKEEELAQIALPQWFPTSERFLKSQNIKVGLGIVAVTGEHYTTIASISPLDGEPRFGFIVDTSADTDLHSSIESSLLGAMRQANCVLTRLKSGNVYRQLEASEIEGILHHMEFYLNPENYPVWFFEGSEKVNVLPLFEIKVDEVEAPENCLDLKIARAHSPDAQSLYLGGGIGEANLNRLTNCFEVDSINSLPHPLV